MRLRERTFLALAYTGSKHQSQDSHSVHTLKICITPSGSARGTKSVGEFPLVGHEVGALGEEEHKNLRNQPLPLHWWEAMLIFGSSRGQMNRWGHRGSERPRCLLRVTLCLGSVRINSEFS